MADHKKTLVIVESPTKAKTIHKYLGKDYIIASSMGHIIDLPKSRLAVDVNNDFKPEYIPIRGKAKLINDLKKKASEASNVLLATDPDREGEAISWHLSNVLKEKNPDIKRIEFHEITEDAIKEAVEKARDINMDLVNAQQARRILDRLVGYYLSPILWKKVKKGLSAGRVQSVALRVICEREKEIENFIPQEYWTLDALFEHHKQEFVASLVSENGNKIELKTKNDVDRVLKLIEGKPFTVSNVEQKERRRKPQPPYITSKLQQDAARRLGFSASKTMMVAQQLYEGVTISGEGQVGLITYMRTDSTRVAPAALASVREYLGKNFSKEYIPESPNFYPNKKGAQDAHEAIRPTNVFRTPESIKNDLTPDQYKLYSLIWKRFVSSQMTSEVSLVVTVTMNVEHFEFRATGSRVLFNGFTVIEKEESAEKKLLPPLDVGQVLIPKSFDPQQHFTSPPPRYNEASLVKFLEESGIGRPSTYAPTINTLLKRYYVTKRGKQLVPTVLGRLVNDIIVSYFESLINIDFTAKMEEKLDLIEEAHNDWVSMIKEFYEPFKLTVHHAEEHIEDMKNILDEETDLVCEKCGSKMVKRLGKYGFFLACSAFPKCSNAKPLPLGKCPKCGGDVIKRTSKRRGSFYACNRYPECDFATREQASEHACPKCGSLLFIRKIKKKGEMLVCLNEQCGYSVTLLDEDKTDAEAHVS